MCGRFALATEKKILEMLFDLELRGALEPRFNIAPSEDILAVRLGAGGERIFSRLKWGLVPHWAKEARTGYKMINARAETADRKPAFRDAFRRRRALVPASGFYEWKKTGQGSQPYYIRMKDKKPFALGALWERWAQVEPPLESCAILTVPANGLVAPLHHRMPVIIPPEAYGLWLSRDSEGADLKPLLQPFPSEMMEAVPLPADIFKTGRYGQYL